jgi:hypothetical protein
MVVIARGAARSRVARRVARGAFDVRGAALAVTALAGIAFALISGPTDFERAGWERIAVVGAGIGGVFAAVAFLAVERSRGRSISDRVPAPMLPLAIFASRQFSVINVITFCVYCATGGELFMLVLELQEGSGFSALAAGSALLPVTVLMIVLSPRSAALDNGSGRAGRPPPGRRSARWARAALRIGGALVSAGYRPPSSSSPGVALIVPPLTATVLASADVRNGRHAGAGHQCRRPVAGLIAVAGLPAVVGLRATAYHSPVLLTTGFHLAMIVCACLLALAAVLAVTLVDDNVLRPEAERRSRPRARRTISARRR